MKKTIRYLLTVLGLLVALQTTAQQHAAVDDVNVFLGSSGDYGQMSPGATSAFSYLDICPQTYPHGHTGYEHLAKKVEGFTHNRFEGVGCKGSGGILLVKPFWGNDATTFELSKKAEAASPGFYKIDFQNGLKASFAVDGYQGIHQYIFPASVKEKKLWVDLSHALNHGFVDEEHQVNGRTITGWIKAKTTCSVGAYKIFYCLQFDDGVQLVSTGPHQLIATLNSVTHSTLGMHVAFSSTNIESATAKITTQSLSSLKTQSRLNWDTELSHIRVIGDPARTKLFYSLLYRAIQSPYLVSEKDGHYRAIDGSLQQSNSPVYHGWSIWDNYKTQLPLLSLAWQNRYQGIVNSIANLYRFDKKDYATMNEPANSVRTEHAGVVLLDAQKKGYTVDFKSIYNDVKKEVDSIESTSPDKKLETAYDLWAFAKIAQVTNQQNDSREYLLKSQQLYQDTWKKEFKDMRKNDVDKLPARAMYQGTVWQYRWLVPYDVKGLIDLSGGEKPFLKQLDYFFDNDLYAHSNEHDIQVPSLYNVTADLWKSQLLMHKIGLDTMVQYYFNTNERDIGASIGHIYNNRPEALLRTMDDDAGAMSSWFVMAACGMFPAAVGYPVYYLNVPYFPSVKILVGNHKYLQINVKNFSAHNCYIKQVLLNGKDLNRTWVSHNEINNGGVLEIVASAVPSNYGAANLFITDMTKD
jgi:putative alpha-1,2-mannosidase